MKILYKLNLDLIASNLEVSLPTSIKIKSWFDCLKSRSIFA